MMKRYQRIEQILLQFRPVFRREATFEWFVPLTRADHAGLML
jgi:hypothetical protein